MAKIKEFLEAKDGSVEIDWSKVEETLGFCVHKGLQEFYSKMECKRVDGTVNFTEEKFIEKTGNERNDTWISFNECEGKVQYELSPISSGANAHQAIELAFTNWTGGNDFGHRALIGQLFFNIGEVLILFNNDTGKVEWMDCGYGYFEVYEENPNGVLANSMEEFLEKLM